MIFRFIDKFISNNVGRKFEANYCNIYPQGISSREKILRNMRLIFLI